MVFHGQRNNLDLNRAVVLVFKGFKFGALQSSISRSWVSQLRT